MSNKRINQLADGTGSNLEPTDRIPIDRWDGLSDWDTFYVNPANLFNNIITKTWQEVYDLKNETTPGETLIPGAIYEINDSIYQDTDVCSVYVQAIDESNLNPHAIRKLRIPLETYYTPAGLFLGVFKPGLNLALPVPYFVIWGNSIWIKIGVHSTTTSDILNNTKLSGFTRIPISDPSYEDKLFKVIYDFDSDWVTVQYDDRGNVYTTEVNANYTGSNYSGYSLLFNDGGEPVLPGFPSGTLTFPLGDGDHNRTFTNPLDYCDYGNPVISKNTATFICNNAINFSIQNNTVDFIVNNYFNGGIVGNNNKLMNITKNKENVTFILNNTCLYIINNNNVGNISNNSNVYFLSLFWGSVCNNTNTGDISDNSNIGEIRSNINTGSIKNNSNKGFIYNNENVGNINDNSNIGKIEDNKNIGNINNNSNQGNIEDNTITCKNIIGNSNSGNINSNSGISYYAPGNRLDIIYNSNNGNINSNIITDYIQYNSNNGDINSNLYFSRIAYNSNNATVYNTINKGNISNNKLISSTGFIATPLDYAGIDLGASTNNHISGNSNKGCIMNNNIQYNSSNASIFDNYNKGDIINNALNATNSRINYIVGNGNNGFISINEEINIIINNHNNGNISDNNLNGDALSTNSNNGDITNNKNLSISGGDLAYNNNNGQIADNQNSIIQNNANNGEISNNVLVPVIARNFHNGWIKWCNGAITYNIIDNSPGDHGQNNYDIGQNIGPTVLLTSNITGTARALVN